MPLDSPDRNDASTQPQAEKLPADQAVPENLETFEIDVAAGNSTHLDSVELSKVPANAPAANKTSPANSELTRGAEVPEGILLGQTVEQPVVAVSISPQSVEIETVDEPEPPAATVVRRVARQSSWWLSSFSVHVIVLVGLALTTLAIPREPELELYASAAAYEPIEEEVFEDLDIDLSEELDSLDEAFDQPDPAPLEELTTETLFEEATVSETSLSERVSTDLSDDISELSSLFGESNAPPAGMDSAVGEGNGGGMAKFFGTEIKARRILYMLDNSGGMRYSGKFEALVSELKRSVNALDAKQEFYVIFYSDTVYPLFYPQGVRKFVRPNARNKKLLDRWLTSVELCGGNAIDEALAAAEVIRPEAVFLLTDGNLFTTEKKKALLLNSQGRSYSIHTFGLGVGETTKTAEGLKQVAEANSGTFQAIKVTDEMKALAQEKERPYHSKSPGPVWGLKVGGR